MAEPTKRKRIFVSYSHSDRQWLEELLTHLAPFRDTTDVWSDSRIDAGADWKGQIDDAISGADAAIVLVTASFLASPFLQEVEVPRLLEASQSEGTLVLPILVSPCLWEETPLVKFQFLNPPDRPLTMLDPAERDAAFVQIARSLNNALFQPKAAKTGLEASADLADEIARKVLAMLKTDLGAHVPVQTDRAGRIEGIDPSLVFVICPFSSDMEPVYEGMASAAKTVGLQAKRMKDVVGDYQITGQIMSMIANARLVIADLSHERPNVYFELGYARGIGKTVVTCAREGTTLHFDVRDWTYIPYNDSRVLEKALIDRFRFELEKGA